MEALEGGLATLRAEVASHKETIAEKEHLLAQHNPRAFHALQARAPLDLPFASAQELPCPCAGGQFLALPVAQALT